MSEKQNIEKHGSLDGMGAAPTNNTPNDETKKMEDEDIPSFGEVRAETEFANTELLTDYRNREIIVRSFEMGEGGYGPYVILSASVNGGTKLLRTSSLVVIDQLQKIRDKLPIKATPVEKNGKNGKKFLSLS